MIDDMAAKSGQATGRRPLVLDEEIRKNILEALHAGNYLETSAAYAGIGKTALYEWLAKGREAQEQIDAGMEVTIPNGHAYAEFTEQVKAAQARAEVRAVANIKKAALTSWQAEAWWLERTRPRLYGRFDRAEISGPEGGPIQVDLADQRAKALALLDEIAARTEQ
jgi:hypothetical protein